MGLVLQTLKSCYAGHIAAPLTPYTGFIQHVMRLDDSTAGEYWLDQLEGAKPPSFPAHPKLPEDIDESAPITHRLAKTIYYPESSTADSDTSVTKANVIRAAWALVLARACDRQTEAERGHESELRPLIYPLVQVSLGAIKYGVFNETSTRRC